MHSCGINERVTHLEKLVAIRFLIYYSVHGDVCSGAKLFFYSSQKQKLKNADKQSVKGKHTTIFKNYKKNVVILSKMDSVEK